MKYWDYIQIREGKPAYNIEMEEQGNWESFLPNQQFNEILLKAIGAVRNNDMDKHRSLWIEGTYGTGKSHAGAVLKHLLCDNVEEIRQWVDEEYRDPQYDILRKQIYSLRERKRLLPITLVGQCGISNKEDLALVLQTRIQKALSSNGIELDIHTDYDNFIQHIEHNASFWELTIAADGELRSIAPDRKRLVKLLRDCDSATLRTAKDACRRQGLSVRLRQENLSRWFFEVQDRLREKTAYNGLLVVWDEFTDVVKSELGISILVELQLLAEEAMNANNDSYFLFISHPSALDRLSAQERTKTIGRYHYLHYNMEPVSAFKIMSRKFRQIKAAIKVNSALLEFYWSVRRDLAVLKAEERWGSGIVKQLAMDMRNAFPEAKGFSDTNVKYMKRWYMFYYEQIAKSHQAGDQLDVTEKSQQLTDQLEMPELFGQIPWYHHIRIFSHCKTLNKALFYMNKTIEEGWSRSWLVLYKTIYAAS